MKIKDIFIVMKAEKKTGTTNDGRSWEKTEYLLKNLLEREDGSIMETHIVADTSQSVGELQVGATYNATVFITSRAYEKDGKTTHFPSFRVTFAECVNDAPKAEPAKEQSVQESVADDIPF